MIRVCILAVCWSAALSAQPSLTGTVTDPSGAAVPGAVVQLRSARGERRTRTDDAGEYSFTPLAAGKYQVRIAAKGFSLAEKKELAINRAVRFDVKLAIHTETEVINVEDALGRVNTEPESNGGAVVLGQRQIAALSDDPDELALQLQALAGPAPGPNGGQIFVDGFSGGSLPPKSAIREIRINANPYSPEYDRPGFSRVEIFTKPGSDVFHGQAFIQGNDRVLNSRNPLLAQSTHPSYRTRLFGANIGGPLRKGKASFTLDLDHRRIDENAFVLATNLDAALNPAIVNQALASPQSRTSISPRLDLALSARQTLVLRYQDVRSELDNQGVGDFNLPSRAYNERQSERTAQVTETAMFSQRAINEMRFQYLRSSVGDAGGSATPGISVQGAFFDGGATTGNSRNVSNNGELSDVFSYTRGGHGFQWGGRIRAVRMDDLSANNFNGTFVFYTLGLYQKTEMLLRQGYTAGGLVALGAGPSQFTINCGEQGERVSQTDVGLFANDDWRVRPNLTLSYGGRYEVQNNVGDLANWAPRIGVAWGIGGNRSRQAKSVLRAGVGVFYDRIPATVTLNNRRYNGIEQQSYFVLNPPFFPAAPAASALQAYQQAQQLRPIAHDAVSPRMYQTSVGIERQLNAGSRATLTWIGSRGVHLLDARNINAPLNGLHPYGDQSVRVLTESSGLSSQNQLVANINMAYRKALLFGNYAVSFGRDNNEGLPADPRDLRAEWGPSSYGDVRHKLVFGASLPARWGFTVMPFFVANSGIPYNITTGLDPNDTGVPAARPAALPSVPMQSCSGGGLQYSAAYGCLDTLPGAGETAIGHNYGRGPAASNVALRVARTWSFGPEGQHIGVGGSGGGEHGGGGPPAGMFNVNTGRKYSLTLSATTLNSLNHPNYAPPNGIVLSPYFGQYRNLGGMIVMSHGGAPTTYNRKIDIQLRLSF